MIAEKGTLVNVDMDACLSEATEFLRQLISFPSLSGTEEPAMAFIEQAFSSLGYKVESIPLTDSLRDDPEYSSPVEGMTYEGRRNLRIVVPGQTDQTLILNAHVDVVPPSAAMQRPWDARLENEILYGRGACDDKGQIAVLYLLLTILSKYAITPVPTLVLHLVVEEENGGNGSLAMIRRGEPADAVIVLEPTARNIVVAARGAVWFRILLTGRSAHSGQSAAGRSALTMARKAMDLIQTYHDNVLAKSRSLPLFDAYEDPMPVTFGVLESGDWPASAPASARLEGVFGFLPNNNRETICEGLHELLREAFPAPGTIQLEFTFRHDGFTIPENHWLPQSLLTAAKSADYTCTAGPMLASSDAWLYHKFLRIPTVLFGAGSLAHAHADDEQVSLKDLRGVCLTLLNLVQSNHVMPADS